MRWIKGVAFNRLLAKFVYTRLVHSNLHSKEEEEEEIIEIMDEEDTAVEDEVNV